MSRAARLSREGSGYLERSGYLEGGVGTTRASRWLGPLRMTRSAQDDSVRYETSHVSRHCKVGVSRISRYVHWGPTVMWLRSRVPRYWPSFTPLGPISAPSCDARVALDGFVHRRRFASRPRQLAAAQPGCSSLDPHATCSEARPQGLATPQRVSHFSSPPSVPLLYARANPTAGVFSHLAESDH